MLYSSADDDLGIVDQAAQEKPEEFIGATTGRLEEIEPPTSTPSPHRTIRGIIAASMYKYAVYSLRYVYRQLKFPILHNGEIISGYHAPKVEEYIDLRTGEILSAAQYEQLSIFKGSVYKAEIARQCETAILSLHPRVRLFAYFVLQFRDGRRGVTPDLRTLAKWYADWKGKIVSDIRRYIPLLEKANICAKDSTLFPIFQRVGYGQSRISHIHAQYWAEVRYAVIKATHEKLRSDVIKLALANEKPMFKGIEDDVLDVDNDCKEIQNLISFNSGMWAAGATNRLGARYA